MCNDINAKNDDNSIKILDCNITGNELIASINGPLNNTVELYTREFDGHIQVNHPEITVGNIERLISNPMCIYTDKLHARITENRFNYFGFISHNQKYKIIKAATCKDENSENERIITVHLMDKTKSIKFGENGEVCLYGYDPDK